MKFFNEYCGPAEISVHQLILALDKIGNIACRNFLYTYLGELRQHLIFFMAEHPSQWLSN